MSDTEDTHEKQPLLDESGVASTNGSLRLPRGEQDTARPQQGTRLRIETHYKPKVCFDIR